jgi:DNA gyrase subunit A
MKKLKHILLAALMLTSTLCCAGCGEQLKEEDIPDYPVTVFVTREGYLKKITPQSLRMSGSQKYKEGDKLRFSRETTNRAEILVFTNQYQCYKARLSDFEDGKASQLGDYLHQKLGMDAEENVVEVIFPGDYKGFILFFFENGKAAKVPLSAYETKSNRRRLTGAYSDKSALKACIALEKDEQVVLYTSDNRAAIFSTALLQPKATRNTIGVNAVTLKKKATIIDALLLEGSGITNPSRYRCRNGHWQYYRCHNRNHCRGQCRNHSCNFCFSHNSRSRCSS